jgi:hypothetical protein
MPKKYQITPIVWCVRDEASTKFHVENDDYFGTIASILSLIKQQMKKDSGSDTATFNKVIDNLENDLLFLQKNYQIKPRRKNSKIIPKGRLISQ